MTYYAMPLLRTVPLNSTVGCVLLKFNELLPALVSRFFL